MLLKDRATHVLWIIFATTFDSDIHFEFWPAEMLMSGQIRSYLHYQRNKSAYLVHFWLRIIKKNLFSQGHQEPQKFCLKRDLISFTLFQTLYIQNNGIAFKFALHAAGI